MKVNYCGAGLGPGGGCQTATEQNDSLSLCGLARRGARHPSLLSFPLLSRFVRGRNFRLEKESDTKRTSPVRARACAQLVCLPVRQAALSFAHCVGLQLCLLVCLCVRLCSKQLYPTQTSLVYTRSQSSRVISSAYFVM